MITKFFRRIGFTPTSANACILIIQGEGEHIIVGVYVDYLALGSRSLEALKWLKNELIKEFNMNVLRKAKKIIK